MPRTAARTTFPINPFTVLPTEEVFGDDLAESCALVAPNQCHALARTCITRGVAPACHLRSLLVAAEVANVHKLAVLAELKDFHAEKERVRLENKRRAAEARAALAQERAEWQQEKAKWIAIESRMHSNRNGEAAAGRTARNKEPLLVIPSHEKTNPTDDVNRHIREGGWVFIRCSTYPRYHRRVLYHDGTIGIQRVQSPRTSSDWRSMANTLTKFQNLGKQVQRVLPWVG